MIIHASLRAVVSWWVRIRPWWYESSEWVCSLDLILILISSFLRQVCVVLALDLLTKLDGGMSTSPWFLLRDLYGSRRAVTLPFVLYTSRGHIDTAEEMLGYIVLD